MRDRREMFDGGAVVRNAAEGTAAAVRREIKRNCMNAPYRSEGETPKTPPLKAIAVYARHPYGIHCRPGVIMASSRKGHCRSRPGRHRELFTAP